MTMNIFNKTTTLPEHYIEHNTIAELPQGTSGYTVPWAMMVTEDKHCFLNGSYTFQRVPGGTSQMLISRDRKGEYSVKIPHGEHYRPTRNIPWVGATESDLVPVSKILD